MKNRYKNKEMSGIPKYTRYFKSYKTANAFSKRIGWRLYSFTEHSGVTKKDNPFNFVVKYIRDTKKNRRTFAPIHLKDKWNEWEGPDSYPEEYFR